ncbi:Tm-1-like ATP-binding domain-containing protein [Thermodesulfobacteriota bacterium]
MDKIVIILVMAEEKWKEADFLRQEIEERGLKTMILDMGLIDEPRGKCDITREDVILASGCDLEDTVLITDRGRRMPTMVEGGKNLVMGLHSQDKLLGVISLGGATGTQMGTSIMKSLPFGVPKVAVSSTASVKGLAERYIGTADIGLIHTVVEFGGLDDLMKNILARAAGSLCGMVDASIRTPVNVHNMKRKSLVAMTHFGPCELCAMDVRKRLEGNGYQVVGFSASGICDRAMEEFIEKMNIFSAVIDLAPGGVGEELLGFARAAGASRLEAAGRKGLPQVITLSGVNFGSPRKSAYKAEYQDRKKYDYDALRSFIRLSADEMVMVAREIARKIDQAKGPVKVIIPSGGWSSVDKRGSRFYDKELDRIFIREFKDRLRDRDVIIEVDADLDTPEFATEIIRAFTKIMEE